nr:MAG TPA: hypothetical protein [Crassvirales sp.]
MTNLYHCQLLLFYRHLEQLRADYQRVLYPYLYKMLFLQYNQ